MRGGVDDYAGAKGESQQIDGRRFGEERAQRCIGGVGVLLKITWCGGASALAVSGVVKDEGGDVVCGEKVLHRLPVDEAISDAMEDEDRGGWCGRGREDGFQGAVVVGDDDCSVG